MALMVRIVIDVFAYKTMFAAGALDPDAGDLDALGRLKRWTVNSAANLVRRRATDETPQEFPRINDRRTGQAHRYVYTVSVPLDGNPQLVGATRLYKHDLGSGHLVHQFGADRMPGDFIFVPRQAKPLERPHAAIVTDVHGPLVWGVDTPTFGGSWRAQSMI